MSSCKACGKPYRRGTLAMILTGPVPMRGVVCLDCKKRGVLVVAPLVERAPAVVKVTRSPELDRAIRRLEGLATVSKAAAEASRGNGNVDAPWILEGRAEAYEAAAELLRRMQTEARPNDAKKASEA